MSSPLPNSYSFLGKTEIRIEKADKINDKKYSKEINGTIVDFFNKDPVIKTKNGLIRLIKFRPRILNKSHIGYTLS